MQRKSVIVGFLSQRAAAILGALLLVAVMSVLPWRCAPNQASYGDGEESAAGKPDGDDISRSVFYSKAAEKQRRKAEQYLEMATSHKKVQGADSALAVHYRHLAEESLKSAEENARFSRYHRQLAEEEFERLREEMLPQP